MPNMFGGASDHPAYAPHLWEPTEDTDLVDQTLYTVRQYMGKWECMAEDVGGNARPVDPPTEKLRKRLEEKRAT